MKLYNLIKYDIRRMSGTYLAFAFLLFILAYFRTKKVLELYQSDYHIGLNDMIYKMFQSPVLSMILVPMFAILCLGLTLREKDDSFMIRFQNRKDYWRTITFRVFFHSCIFSLVTIGMGLLAAFLLLPLENFWNSDQGFIYENIKNTSLEAVWRSNAWRFTTPFVLGMCFILGSVTYMATGLVVQLLFMLANNRVIALILLLLIAINDTYLSFFSILYRFSFLYLTYWFDLTAFLINVTYLLVLSLLIFLLGSYAINKRDYLALRRWNIEGNH